MTRMLGRAAKRRAVHGCTCHECDVAKTNGAQRAHEKRLWMRDESTPKEEEGNQ